MLAQQEYVPHAQRPALYILKDSYPIQHSPSLADHIGDLPEKLLQRLMYWITSNGHERDGQYWTYDSYKALARKLGGLTSKQIRNAVDTLRAGGWINVTNEYNQRPGDRTYWYAVNFEKVAEFETTIPEPITTPKKAKYSAPEVRPNALQGRPSALQGTALPEIPTEIPTEIHHHQESRAGGGSIHEGFLPTDDETTIQDAVLIVDLLGAMPREAQRLATQATAARNEYGPTYIADLIDDITNAPEIKDPIAVLAWRIKTGARTRPKKGDLPLDPKRYGPGGKFSHLFNRDQGDPQEENTAIFPTDDQGDPQEVPTNKQGKIIPLPPPSAWTRAAGDLARRAPKFSGLAHSLKYYGPHRDNPRVWFIGTTDENAEQWKSQLEAELEVKGAPVTLIFGLI